MNAIPVHKRNIMPTLIHKTTAELNEALPFIQQSPQTAGILEAIVARPGTNERTVLKEAQLSLEGGLQGDRWHKKYGPDHTENQISIINIRVIDLMATDPDHRILAGDNLYVDFDISADHLKPGQQFSIGEVVLEITPKPHNGCKKFAQRFGQDAVRWVNTPTGKHLHLRGIFARVIQGGTIRVGDTIRRSSMPEHQVRTIS